MTFQLGLITPDTFLISPKKPKLQGLMIRYDLANYAVKHMKLMVKINVIYLAIIHQTKSYMKSHSTWRQVIDGAPPAKLVGTTTGDSMSLFICQFLLFFIGATGRFLRCRLPRLCHQSYFYMVKSVPICEHPLCVIFVSACRNRERLLIFT